MRQAAMARDFHWSGAAAEYEQLYRRLSGPPVADAAPQPARPRRRVRQVSTELPAAA
jgi:hypothetical protein